MICALQLQLAVAKRWHMLCLCYIVLLGKHGTSASAMPGQTQPVTSLARTNCTLHLSVIVALLRSGRHFLHEYQETVLCISIPLQYSIPLHIPFHCNRPARTHSSTHHQLYSRTFDGVLWAMHSRTCPASTRLPACAGVQGLSPGLQPWWFCPLKILLPRCVTQHIEHQHASCI